MAHAMLQKEEGDQVPVYFSLTVGGGRTSEAIIAPWGYMCVSERLLCE